MFKKNRKEDQDATNSVYRPLPQSDTGAQTPLSSQRTASTHSYPHTTSPTPQGIHRTSQSIPTTSHQAMGISESSHTHTSPMQVGLPTQKAPTKKRTVIIVLLSILVAVIVWLLIWLFACNGSDLFDSSARTGQAPYKSEEEIQAELNRTVDEGMFNISIASSIQFEDGTTPGTAYIENVPGNRYYMQVTITDDDTGDVLYESGVLKPNQYIEDITLVKDLDAGLYDATATFKALDLDTFEDMGTAAAKVTLSVAA